MAHFEITGSVDPLLNCSLEKGEKILTESNAMVAMDGNLSLKGKARGGVLSSITRKLFNDESFFQQAIEAEDGPGSALLAPNIPGDIRILDVGERQYMISDGSFLAATEGVELNLKTQSLGRALLGDSGGFFLMATAGRGQVAISGFGSMREIEVRPGQTLIIDNGHLVAWDTTLDYELSINTAKSGLFGKLVHSQTTGEGIVLKFRGEGKIYVCSRNKGGFVEWICGQMPTQNAAQN